MKVRSTLPDPGHGWMSLCSVPSASSSSRIRDPLPPPPSPCLRLRQRHPPSSHAPLPSLLRSPLLVVVVVALLLAIATPAAASRTPASVVGRRQALAVSGGPVAERSGGSSSPVQPWTTEQGSSPSSSLLFGVAALLPKTSKSGRQYTLSERILRAFLMGCFSVFMTVLAMSLFMCCWNPRPQRGAEWSKAQEEATAMYDDDHGCDALIADEKFIGPGNLVVKVHVEYSRTYYLFMGIITLGLHTLFMYLIGRNWNRGVKGKIGVTSRGRILFNLRGLSKRVQTLPQYFVTGGFVHLLGIGAAAGLIFYLNHEELFVADEAYVEQDESNTTATDTTTAAPTAKMVDLIRHHTRPFELRFAVIWLSAHVILLFRGYFGSFTGRDRVGTSCILEASRLSAICMSHQQVERKGVRATCWCLFGQPQFLNDFDIRLFFGSYPEVDQLERSAAYRHVGKAQVEPAQNLVEGAGGAPIKGSKWGVSFKRHGLGFTVEVISQFCTMCTIALTVWSLSQESQRMTNCYKQLEEMSRLGTLNCTLNIRPEYLMRDMIDIFWNPDHKVGQCGDSICDPGSYFVLFLEVSLVVLGTFACAISISSGASDMHAEVLDMPTYEASIGLRLLDSSACFSAFDTETRCGPGAEHDMDSTLHRMKALLAALNWAADRASHLVDTLEEPPDFESQTEAANFDDEMLELKPLQDETMANGLGTNSAIFCRKLTLDISSLFMAPGEEVTGAYVQPWDYPPMWVIIYTVCTLGIWLLFRYCFPWWTRRAIIVTNRRLMEVTTFQSTGTGHRLFSVNAYRFGSPLLFASRAKGFSGACYCLDSRWANCDQIVLTTYFGTLMLTLLGTAGIGEYQSSHLWEAILTHERLWSLATPPSFARELGDRKSGKKQSPATPWGNEDLGEVAGELREGLPESCRLLASPGSERHRAGSNMPTVGLGDEELPQKPVQQALDGPPPDEANKESNNKNESEEEENSEPLEQTLWLHTFRKDFVGLCQRLGSPPLPSLSDNRITATIEFTNRRMIITQRRVPFAFEAFLRYICPCMFSGVVERTSATPLMAMAGCRADDLTMSLDGGWRRIMRAICCGMRGHAVASEVRLRFLLARGRVHVILMPPLELVELRLSNILLTKKELEAWQKARAAQGGQDDADSDYEEDDETQDRRRALQELFAWVAAMQCVRASEAMGLQPTPMDEKQERSTPPSASGGEGGGMGDMMKKGRVRFALIASRTIAASRAMHPFLAGGGGGGGDDGEDEDEVYGSALEGGVEGGGGGGGGASTFTLARQPSVRARSSNRLGATEEEGEEGTTFTERVGRAESMRGLVPQPKLSDV